MKKDIIDIFKQIFYWPNIKRSLFWLLFIVWLYFLTITLFHEVGHLFVWNFILWLDGTIHLWPNDERPVSGYYTYQTPNRRLSNWEMLSMLSAGVIFEFLYTILLIAVVCRHIEHLFYRIFTINFLIFMFSLSAYSDLVPDDEKMNDGYQIQKIFNRK